jgi:F-box/TPR repeat protein Pof3
VDLDLSYAKREVSRVFVRNAVNWSGARTKRMVVHRFRHSDVLRNIATACKELEEMIFLSGGMLADTVIEVAQCGQNLKKLVLHTNVNFDTIAQILRFRPTLEHAEFSSIVSAEVTPHWKGPYPNLRYLGLTYDPPPPRSRLVHVSLETLLQNAPNLEHLRVKGTTALSVPNGREFAALTPNLKEYTHSCLIPDGWPSLGEKVERLDLKAAYSYYLPSAVSIRAATPLLLSIWEHAQGPKVWKLEHLSLHGFQNMNPDFLSALLDYYVNDAGDVIRIKDDDQVSNLQHLSISDCTFPDEPDLFGLNGLLTCSRRILSPALQSLDLSGLSVTNGDIKALITHHIPLRTISLARTSITGAGVKTLVDGIPSLELVNADDCSKISSRDIIEYAKGKGVIVSMKMTDVRGGKTVRY